MKQAALAFFFSTLAMLAGAQTAAPAEQPANLDAERARISADRARLEAGFLAEDAACYQRFAVNRCLGEVNARRREAMAGLRRQEILLNDEERKIKGAEQIRKTEEKSSPEKLQEEADRRAQALKEHQQRLDRDKEKQQNRATAQSNEQAKREGSADRLRGSQDKARARSEQQGAAAEAARKFDERQKEAQARRAQHESERLKRTKPPARSLPLPE